MAAGDRVLGLDVGATKFRIAVAGPDGRAERTVESPTRARRGPEAVIEELIGRLSAVASATTPRPTALGVGVAAQVDARGTVRFAPNLRWADVPLGARLEEGTGLPVRVLNDVRAATVAEWRLGAGRGATDLVCLFDGTGLGGGVVSGGRLLIGAGNTAGELGHLTVVSGGRRCTCPNAGCLEAYVGGWAIAARAREAARADAGGAARLVARAGGRLDGVTAEAVLTEAAAGDAFCGRLKAETREYLAAGLVGIANAFNPSTIVGGGGIFDGAPDLLSDALALARPRMLPSVGESLRLAPSQIGAGAVAIGAATWARGGLV